MNDVMLKHSVGVILKELHTFAQATGAPAGENVFRWAESMADQVSDSPAPKDRDPEAEGVVPSAEVIAAAKRMKKASRRYTCENGFSQAGEDIRKVVAFIEGAAK